MEAQLPRRKRKPKNKTKKIITPDIESTDVTPISPVASTSHEPSIAESLDNVSNNVAPVESKELAHEIETENGVMDDEDEVASGDLIFSMDTDISEPQMKNIRPVTFEPLYPPIPSTSVPPTTLYPPIPESTLEQILPSAPPLQMFPSAPSAPLLDSVNLNSELPKVVPALSDYVMDYFYENKPLKDYIKNRRPYHSSNSAPSSPSDPEFSERLHRYAQSHLKVIDAKSRIDSLQLSIKSLAQDTWKITKVSQKVESVCADGYKLSHSFDDEIAKFDDNVAEEVKIKLAELRNSSHRELLDLLAQEKLSKLWVQNFIDDFFSHSTNWGRAERGLSETKVDDVSASEILKVRTYVAILFQAERSIRSSSSDLHEDAFLKDVRGWILHLSWALLMYQRPEDFTLLVHQVLRSVDIHTWGTHIIQPMLLFNQPSDEFVDQLLLAFYLLFHPLPDILEEQERQYRANEYKKQQAKQLEKSDWIVIDDMVPDPQYLNESEHYVVLADGSRVLFTPSSKFEYIHPLSEEDYLQIIDQLPIHTFIRNLMLHYFTRFKQNMSHNFIAAALHDLIKPFAILRKLIDIIMSGLQFVRRENFPMFLKRSARELVACSQALGTYLAGELLTLLRDFPAESFGDLLDESILFKRRHISSVNSVTSIQSEIDAIYFGVTFSLLKLENLRLWQFLGEIDYQYISLEGCWKLLDLLTCRSLSDVAAVESAESCLNRAKELEKMFSRGEYNFPCYWMERKPEEALFLITTITNLCISREPYHQFVSKFVSGTSGHQASMPTFPTPAISEFLILSIQFIFYLSYVHSELRRSLHKPVRGLLSLVINSFPTLLSDILSYVDTYFDHIGTMSVHLLSGLPLHMWNMTEEDVSVIRRFLSHPIEKPQFKVAQYILSNLDFASISYEHRISIAVAITEFFVALTNAEGGPSSPAISFTSNFSQLVGISPQTSSLLNTPTTLLSFQTWVSETLLQLQLAPFVNSDSLLSFRSSPRLTSLKSSCTRTSLAGLTILLVSDITKDHSLFEQYGWQIIQMLKKEGRTNWIQYLFERAIPLVLIANDRMATSVDHNWRELFQNLDALETAHGILGMVMHATRLSKSIYSGPRLSLSYIQNSANETPAVSCIVRILFDAKYVDYKEGQNLYSPKLTGLACAVTRAVTSLPNWHTDYKYVYLLDSVFYVAALSNAQSFVVEILILYLQEFANSKSQSYYFSGAISSSVTQAIDIAKKIPIPEIPIPKSLPDSFSNLSFSSLSAASPIGIPTSLPHYLQYGSSTSPLSFSDLGDIEAFPVYSFFILFSETVNEYPIRRESHFYSLQNPRNSLKESVEMISKQCLKDVCILKWSNCVLNLSLDNPLWILFLQGFIKLLFERYDFDNGYELSFGYRLLQESGKGDMIDLIIKRLQNFVRQTKSSELRSVARAACIWLGSDQFCRSLPTTSETFPSEFETKRLMSCLTYWDSSSSACDWWLDLLDQEDLLNRLRSRVNWVEPAPTSPVSHRPPLTQAPRKSSTSFITNYQEPPHFLPHEPLIASDFYESLQTDLKSVPPVIESSVSVLMRAAQDFSANINLHSALDSDYLGCLARLYENEIKQAKVEKLCHESSILLNLPLTNQCRGPAILRYRYKHPTVVAQVREACLVNRSKVQTLMNHWVVDSNASISLLRIEKAMEWLIDTYERFYTDAKMREAAIKIENMAINLFYYIIMIKKDDESEYPLLTSLISATVQKIGKKFILSDPNQQSRLWKLLKDFSKMSSIEPLFCPSMSPDFLNMYQSIVTSTIESFHSSTYRNATTMINILNRFDVKVWLNQRVVSKDDQVKFMKLTIDVFIAFISRIQPEHFRENRSAAGGSDITENVRALDITADIIENSVLQTYRYVFKSFLSVSLPIVVTELFQYVFAHSIKNTLPSIIYIDIFEVIGKPPLSSTRMAVAYPNTVPARPNADFTFSLGWHDINRVLSFFQNYFRSLHDSGVNVLETFDLYAQYIIDFYYVVVSVMIKDKVRLVEEEEPFELVKQLFNPWVESYPSHAGGDLLQSRSEPEMVDDDLTIFLERREFILKRLIELINLLMDTTMTPYSTASKAWSWIESLVPRQVPGAVNCLFTENIGKLQWAKSFTWSKIDLRKIQETQASLNGIYLNNFNAIVSSVMGKVDWNEKSKDLEMLRDKEYLLILANVVVYILLDIRKGDDAQGLFEQISNQCIERMPWYILSSEDYGGIIDRLKKDIGPVMEWQSCFQLIRRIGDIPDAMTFNHQTAPISLKGQANIYIYTNYVISLVERQLRQMAFTNSCNFTAGHLATVITDTASLHDLISNVAIPNEIASSYRSLYQLLNRCIPTHPSFSAMLSAFSDSINNCRFEPSLRYILSTVCTTVASIRCMTVLTEHVLDRWFFLTKSASTWNQVVQIMMVPELGRQEFVETCVENCHFLILHAATIQELSSVEGDMANTIQYVNETLFGYFEKVQESVERYQDETKAKQVKKLSLLFVQFSSLYSWIDEFFNDGFNENPLHADGRLLKFTSFLFKLGEEKQKAGILGIVGLGHKSNIDVEFRLFCRIVATFLVTRSRGRNVSSSSGADWDRFGDSESLIKSLKELVNNEDCKGCDEGAKWALEVLDNSELRLKHFGEFVKTAARMLLLNIGYLFS
ncbi:hypothetical protein BKA69DRAFT_1174709 [Paraphysoderma sedebokerense]|nr:hypothetical protein BKA69DRAFT_1174709 [Paraphysoderma sedebokerense]